MTGDSAPLLRTVDLTRVYEVPGGRLYAVDHVSFDVWPGEAVAVVGESGSGKSTIARCLLRLDNATSGQVYFKGHDITHMREHAFRPLRRHAQMVFQDPLLSLNPWLTVRQTLSEPLRLHNVVPRRGLDAKLRELLDLVNLDHALLERRPRELSGGQRQRVAIARAIATYPDFVVLDEPTSSLDMSVRVQIIELLRRLKQELGMAYLFITHDLSTVRYLCSRTIVMYLGRVMEVGPTDEIFTRPQHPYTRALISSIPVPDPRVQKRRIILPGETPSPTQRIPGCPLASRCLYVMEDCTRAQIPMFRAGDDGRHQVACLLYRDRQTPRRVEEIDRAHAPVPVILEEESK
jgi:oligopeptide/dipeptide ABC transporter ATP-binding protein